MSSEMVLRQGSLYKKRERTSSVLKKNDFAGKYRCITAKDYEAKASVLSVLSSSLKRSSKPWQFGYFLLKKTRSYPGLLLEEYKDASLKVAKHTLFLDGLRHVGPVNTSKSKQFAFQVVAAGRSPLLFACENELLMNEWMETFASHAETSTGWTPDRGSPEGSPATSGQVGSQKDGAKTPTPGGRVGYEVTTQSTPLSTSNGLQGDCILQVSKSRIYLKSVDWKEDILSWPLTQLRAFKSQPEFQQLVLETGRKGKKEDEARSIFLLPILRRPPQQQWARRNFLETNARFLQIIRLKLYVYLGVLVSQTDGHPEFAACLGDKRRCHFGKGRLLFSTRHSEKIVQDIRAASSEGKGKSTRNKKDISISSSSSSDSDFEKRKASLRSTPDNKCPVKVSVSRRHTPTDRTINQNQFSVPKSSVHRPLSKQQEVYIDSQTEDSEDVFTPDAKDKRKLNGNLSLDKINRNVSESSSRGLSGVSETNDDDNLGARSDDAGSDPEKYYYLQLIPDDIETVETQAPCHPDDPSDLLAQVVADLTEPQKTKTNNGISETQKRLYSIKSKSTGGMEGRSRDVGEIRRASEPATSLNLAAKKMHEQSSMYDRKRSQLEQIKEVLSNENPEVDRSGEDSGSEGNRKPRNRSQSEMINLSQCSPLLHQKFKNQTDDSDLNMPSPTKHRGIGHSPSISPTHSSVSLPKDPLVSMFPAGKIPSIPRKFVAHAPSITESSRLKPHSGLAKSLSSMQGSCTVSSALNACAKSDNELIKPGIEVRRNSSGQVKNDNEGHKLDIAKRSSDELSHKYDNLNWEEGKIVIAEAVSVESGISKQENTLSSKSQLSGPPPLPPKVDRETLVKSTVESQPLFQPPPRPPKIHDYSNTKIGDKGIEIIEDTEDTEADESNKDKENKKKALQDECPPPLPERLPRNPLGQASLPESSVARATSYTNSPPAVKPRNLSLRPGAMKNLSRSTEAIGPPPLPPKPELSAPPLALTKSAPPSCSTTEKIWGRSKSDSHDSETRSPHSERRLSLLDYDKSASTTSLERTERSAATIAGFRDQRELIAAPVVTVTPPRSPQLLENQQKLSREFSFSDSNILDTVVGGLPRSFTPPPKVPITASKSAPKSNGGFSGHVTQETITIRTRSTTSISYASNGKSTWSWRGGKFTGKSRNMSFPKNHSFGNL